MIVVKYACTCGNTVSPPAREQYQCSSKGGYEIIHTNVEIICGDCGKTMILQVTKETQETKTEVIRQGDEDGV